MADTVIRPELSAEEISKLTRETNYGTWRFQKSWKPLTITDAEFERGLDILVTAIAATV